MQIQWLILAVLVIVGGCSHPTSERPTTMREWRQQHAEARYSRQLSRRQRQNSLAVMPVADNRRPTEWQRELEIEIPIDYFSVDESPSTNRNNARGQSNRPSSARYRETFTTLTMFHGGEERSAIWTPAPVQKNTLTPLVIVLHGGGGHAEGAVQRFRMHDLGQKVGFHTVYPQGSRREDGRRSWNAGQRSDFDSDDVGFISVLIKRLVKEYSVDPQRVYVTGFSAGGMMAYRLGCELSEQIAAIAPVAGALTFDKCRPTRPVALFHIHGERDQNVPLNGENQSNVRRADYRPLQSTITRWQNFNHCQPDLIPILSEYDAIADCRNTKSCNGDRTVAFCTVQNMGHQWPGASLSRRQQERGEQPIDDFAANDLIWQFFQARRLP